MPDLIVTEGRRDAKCNYKEGERTKKRRHERDHNPELTLIHLNVV